MRASQSSVIGVVLGVVCVVHCALFILLSIGGFALHWFDNVWVHSGFLFAGLVIVCWDLLRSSHFFGGSGVRAMTVTLFVLGLGLMSSGILLEFFVHHGDDRPAIVNERIAHQFGSLTPEPGERGYLLLGQTELHDPQDCKICLSEGGWLHMMAHIVFPVGSILLVTGHFFTGRSHLHCQIEKRR